MLLYLARLIRIAWITTLGVGGGFALLFFIFIVLVKGEHHAAQAALFAGFAIGVAFTIIMLLIMVVLDLAARLFIAKAVSNTFWDLEQRRELILDGSVKQIAEACRQALLAVPNASSVTDDWESLTARGLTGASWRSPGEEIEIKMSPVNEHSWKVCCISRSKSPHVVFDYGKNFENVETWRKRIVAALKASTKAT